MPGLLSGANRGALDWGPQNLIAYGAHSYVVVLDPSQMVPFQTLDEHRAHVTSVRWPSSQVTAAGLAKQYVERKERKEIFVILYSFLYSFLILFI